VEYNCKEWVELQELVVLKVEMNPARISHPELVQNKLDY
jgi:hypothetical protein